MRTEPLLGRLGAAGLALNGVWFGALVPFHPNILTGSVAQDVLDDPLWRVSHTAMFLVGLTGVFVALALSQIVSRTDFSRVLQAQPAQPAKSRVGAWLPVATIVTAVSTAGTGLVEATVFPVLADHSPGTLTFDGLFTSPWFALTTGPWLLYPLCLGAFGLLAYRNNIERSAGRLLAAGAVAFFVLGMWFVPVLGPLSCVVFGAALLWWASIVWAATPVAEAGPSQ